MNDNAKLSFGDFTKAWTDTAAHFQQSMWSGQFATIKTTSCKWNMTNARHHLFKSSTVSNLVKNNVNLNRIVE